MNNIPRKLFRTNGMFGLRFFSIVLMLALWTAAAAGEESADEFKRPDERRVNLQESIEMSLNVHPQIKAWRFQLEKVENESRVARSNFGPSLSVSYRHNEIISQNITGPEDTDYLDQNIDSVDLALVQPVFNGFATYNEYQRSEMARQMTHWQVLDAELDVVKSVQTEFLILLQYREEVKSLKETVNRLQQNLEAAQAFYDTDMAPYVQVLQAEVDLANARQQMSQAEMLERTQTVKLNVLLGLSPDAAVVYEGSLEVGLSAFPAEMDACLQYALSNRPDLLAARMNIRLSEKEVAKGRGKHYPSINLEGHYIDRDSDYDELGISALGMPYERDQENRYWLVGLSVTWDLFNSGKNHYSIQALKSEVEKQRVVTRLLEDEIHTEIRTNHMAMRESWDRIELTKKAIAVAKENYQMSKKQYQLQLNSSQEVLNAQDRLARTEANYNQAMADYRLSLANLYAAMGIRNDALLPGAGSESDLLQKEAQ